MRRILGYFILLMMIITSQIFAGIVYYVDATNGNDLNNGTSLASAWRTIAKANSTLQAGDTVYILAGTYTGSSNRINPNNSGSDGNPITYTNYQSDEVTLQGTGGDAITLTGNSYITVDSIDVDGELPRPNATINSWVAMENANTHHNIVQNCTMEYADAWAAIAINNGAHHNKVLNNTLSKVGISNPPNASNLGDLIELRDNAHHNLIEGNDITASGHNLIALTANGAGKTCNYNIVRNNTLDNGYVNADNWRGGRVLELQPESGENKWNLVEGNIIRDADQHQTDGAFPNIGMKLASSNCIVRRNRFYNNIGNGIMESSSSSQTPTDNRVYNNTFYYNGHGGRTNRAGIGFYEWGSPFGGSAYKNNIFYDNNLGPYQFAGGSQAGDFTFANNYESGDPKFVDAVNGDFQLQSDSLCINTGAWLTTITSPSGSGTSFTVLDAGYFCDGFDLIEGDLIQLENHTQTVRIINVDYDNNIITVDTSLTWYYGQGVSLAYSGYAPDIGAHEYTGTSPLNVNISASPTSGYVPLTVNFTGNATGGINPYSYTWNFGDGQSSSQENPSHAYSTAGSYTVTLTVTDSASNQDSDSLSINATDIIMPLAASFIASPTSGYVPLTVNFTGSATGGTEPYTYSWDFGDGNSDSGKNPSHPYSQAGDYTVTFTVTDKDVNQDTDSLIINAYAPGTALAASFIASPTSGEVPLTVNFTGSATGGVLPYSYSWDFGDGTSSSEQNPSHTYSQAGDYTAYLTVTGSDSNQDSDSLIINASAPTNSAYLSCSPKSLYFGATNSGNETRDQYLRIINGGSGTLTWNIEDDADWLFCSPSSGIDRGEITVSVDSSGLSLGLYIATIIVSSPEAYNSPQYVSVNLRVHESEQENPPFGSLDTLVDGSTVSGSIPITGWVLDDIEVIRLEIKRNSDPVDPPEAIGQDGFVYIGDAVFVEGARPDVEESYPDYPLNSRAGWGYMLLTNDLPYRGNGAFTIYTFAYDASGHREETGRKTILCDNANSVKPFGTVDTPWEGESISGSDYINFGWTLTPLPKTIPKDGSTISVWVDGVLVGHPVYDQYREDIATLYPEYNNAQGAVGYYHLNTTQYENGVHTITWSVVDDEGEVDGIGAKYFFIDNIETGNVHPGPFVFKRVYQEDVEGRLRIGIKEVRRGYRLRVDNESEINKKDILGIQTEEMETRREYRLRADNEREINKKGILEIQPEEMETRSRYRLRADDGRDINIEDILKIQIEEMEPIRIVFEGSSEGNMKYIGWGENKWKALPIGSTLDREKGIFSWIPTPGFIGRYVFHFAVTDGSYMSKPLRVEVNVIPKGQK